MVRNQDSFESLLTKLGEPGWSDPAHTGEMETLAMQKYSARSRRRANTRGFIVAAMMIGAPLVGTIGYATGGMDRIFRWLSVEVVNSSGEIVHSVDLEEASDGAISMSVNGEPSMNLDGTPPDGASSGLDLTYNIVTPSEDDVIIRSSRHPDGISLNQLLRDAGVLEPVEGIGANTGDQDVTVGDASVHEFLGLKYPNWLNLTNLVNGAGAVADAVRFVADFGEIESDWDWTDALGRPRDLYILLVAETENDEQLMVRVAYTHYRSTGLAQIIMTDQLTSCLAASEESFVEMLWQDGEAVLVFEDIHGHACDVVLDSADHLGDAKR